MFSTLPIHSLQRLQVADGLLLTADRWQIAHNYHRQRQNLHFQALAQPGIVQGLGICPVSAPADVASQYRDGRWLQVQPGFAVDRQGNPILVPQPIHYRIAAQPHTDPMWVYLVLSFVDPDQLDTQPGTHVAQETFRLEEKVSPPNAREIELCRIALAPGDDALRVPGNGFVPSPNELDLRYRPVPQFRPQGELHLGYLTVTAAVDAATETALQGLVTALPGLYPAFHGNPDIGQVNIRQGPTAIARQEELQAYDLLHMSMLTSQQLQADELELLQSYLDMGGVLLVETPANQAALAELLPVWRDVMESLVGLKATPANHSLQAELHHERAELERHISTELAALMPPLAALIPPHHASNGTPGDWQHAGQLPPQHPLRNTPFAFGVLPTMNDIPLALFNWGGLVITLGELSAAWGGPPAQLLPREILRSAQELGINLLHFAWQRRHWAHCLTPVTPTLRREPTPLPRTVAQDAPLATPPTSSSP